MTYSKPVFPSKPENADPRIITPSADFQKDVIRVAGAILLFIGVYLLLVIAACGFAAACAVAGFFTVTFKPSFITLMLGLGLAGLGAMVLFFMLKFLFKRNKADNSNLVEVTEREQPQLFAFIKQLTAETQTPMPARVFLSAEVNASVFYDSTFWSMFLPIKKNLIIGLGLVNSLNLSELKAVLAHEFGHFSQRSMKLGSYVYHVNNVLYNLLYDNDGYTKMLEKWAGVSGYFAFFASIAAGVVRGAQWILRQVFSVVNKRYLSLSRQMEFHADAVAAFVTGGNHLITALRRTEYSAICYSRLIDTYNNWVENKKRPDNLFPQHTSAMQFLAELNQIPVAHDLPQITADTLSFGRQSRLVVKDQWASHPSTDDREAHLLSLNLTTETNHSSAWSLLIDPEKWQQQLTDVLFRGAPFNGAPALVSLPEFEEEFRQEVTSRTFDSAYKGFYDDRTITTLDVHAAAAEPTGFAEENTLNDLISDAAGNLGANIAILEEEMEALEQIRTGETSIKTFDFAGNKYEYHQAYLIIAQLERELAEKRAQLELTDKTLFQFFYHKALAKNKGAQLQEKYQELYTQTAETTKDVALYNEVFEAMKPVFVRDLQIHEAKELVARLQELEQPVMQRIRALLTDPEISLPEKQRKQAEQFLTSSRKYINDSGFISSDLNELKTMIDLFIQTSSGRTFETKRRLLSWQLGLLQQQSHRVEEALALS